ncbi:MAG TPA: LPS export ABC transporter permease LptF [Rhizomicrobium sp.]|jgi:lipopolysaccharide export system permease protein|nr:LPS export ABC transporter permease LptF [Rhizomicrobium sp.]
MTQAPPPGPEIEVQRRFWLPRLSRYVLGQLLGPVVLVTLLLTCVFWLTQFPRLLDLVINQGQSAPTFLYLTSLLLPTLLVIIVPIAFFLGTLFALSRLNGDSELVVMASAGFSQRQLAAPVFIAAAFVMAITWICALWLMPLGQRALSAKEVDIRADIGAALLNAGDFMYPAKGLTVFIRQLGNKGQMSGILVHDNRDTKRPVTYIAQRGVLAQTAAGSRLIMYDGTLEQAAGGGAQLSVLTFKTDSLSLDQFAGPTGLTLRKTQERYLGELLNPPETQGVTPQIRKAWAAEAHNRLSQPLYCLAFAMIALAAILRGRRQRGALAMRLTAASLAATGLRIAGYGLAGPASSHPSLYVLFYLIPLLGTALAFAVLMGYGPAARKARRDPAGVAA